MQSKLFTLHVPDFIKGAVVAVFSSVVAFVALAVQSPDFSFASMDWNAVGTVAFSAFIGYLAKNFTSETKSSGTEKVVGVELPKPPTTPE